MTQIKYLRFFKDGKWSEGYTEIDEPISRYRLPCTAGNVKQVEDYLKKFNFKKADELYNRLSYKYPAKDYLKLRRKYLKKMEILEIINNRKNNNMGK